MTIRRSRLAVRGSKRRTRKDRIGLTDRKPLLETLESRMLLAVGPRLAGVQPNNSDLFSFDNPAANVRSVAPRELTLRFDENQQIDPNTLAGVRVVRSGFDNVFGNGNDVVVPLGFVGVGKSPSENEIVIRFAESLPDDVYRVEVLGAGSTTPLANLAGEVYVPRLADGDGDPTKDTIQFELDLGPQVVAVVPQPVERNAQGALQQLRNQIHVYFNQDELSVESAQNRDYYQLIYTNNTVRNTDDVVVKPVSAVYERAANRVILTFAQDLDLLTNPDTGALIGPGTFRLRIGTDEALPLAPQLLSPSLRAASDFNTADAAVIQFTAVRAGEQDIVISVSQRDLGAGSSGAPRINVVGRLISVELNSGANVTTARQVVDAINQHPEASKLVAAAVTPSSNPTTLVGNRAINYSPIVLTGLGSSFDTATDLTDDMDEGPVLVVTGSGWAFQDGQFFHINGVKFEFDGDVPQSLNDPVSRAIPFHVNMSQAEMTAAVANAINAVRGPAHPAYQVFAQQAGNRIKLRGENSVDLTSNPSGLRKEYANRFDSGQVIEILGGGDLFSDGQTFELVDSAGVTRTFEFDSTSAPGVQPGRFAVTYTPQALFNANQMAAAVAAAINGAPGGVTALAVGSRVQLEGGRFVRVAAGVRGMAVGITPRFDSGPVLSIVQNGSSAWAGTTFRLTDDLNMAATFEFGSSVQTGNVPIPFQAADTAERLAERIVEAINTAAARPGLAGFRIQATALGTQVYLTNDLSVSISRDVPGIVRTTQGLVISSSIDARPFLLDFPGANDEPGHRNIPSEVGSGIQGHYNEDFADGGRDGTAGVTTILFNFQDNLGVDAQGNPITNSITEQQKTRAREAFQLWGHYLGVQFLESASEGMTIATGNLTALDPTNANVLDFSTNNFRVRINPSFADSLLIMDQRVQWNDEYGANWFINSMVGIGSMLGLDLANDLPVTTLMARFTAPASPYLNQPDPEPIFPGNADILHGQFMYRPDSIDVDLYRFQIDLEDGREGLFTAETFAERLPNSSLLNTVITLYRENADGTREVIARNDDYFGRDSFIEMSLKGGAYYIGVSASGNVDFDPTIDDTGLGGTSQGAYDLRLNFRSQVGTENTISDVDGVPTALDGDADGIAGGTYNFWFQTQPLNRTLDVTDNGSRYVDGQVLTLTNSTGAVRRFEFDSNGTVAAGNIRVPFEGGATPTSAAQMAQRLAEQINLANFQISATVVGSRITLVGERSLRLSTGFVGVAIRGKTIFVDKTAGPNADGSLSKPFNNISRVGVTNAFDNTHPGDIVRIVGNGGRDGLLDTVEDNFAYEIGRGTLPNQILSDGEDMVVPRGVTVMIEPGSIFKLRSAYIGVGSSSLTANRSGGALQVLGTPDRNVYFTSWLNENVGFDTHAPTTVPAAGDWGGILFRADVDRAEVRANLEDEGIFLNYVNHADISYGGGGNVVIDSVQQVVNPIQMVQTRPTISFNRITNSADSAISASPNSFDETNFHAPRFQSGGRFTSDYTRVGPEIHGNFLANNSINGLFIRVETPAGNTLQSLTVSGRFDDIDITHVLAENLVIQGSSGDPLLDLSRPAVNLITFTPRSGGTLSPGAYQYKITFVDRNGFEGRPSHPTATAVVTTANAAIQLNQLPPAGGDFVARRIYRASAASSGQYVLVAQINASDTVYVDPGTSLPQVLLRDPPSEQVTATTQPRGSLPAGTYNYRLIFVDAQGREGASSDPTANIAVAGTPTEGGIVLSGLPRVTGSFVALRIYRSTAGGGSPYRLVGEVDGARLLDPAFRFVDDGFTGDATLDPSTFGVIRARPPARLKIDPGTVVKFQGGRIESRFGAQLIAEGTAEQRVVFTSLSDDSFGAGGTFDTNNDDRRAGGENQPRRGDWGGLYFGPLSAGSLDHAFVAYGGGINRIEGTFTGFNVIEVHQAQLRLTNSVIENNSLGIGGQGPLDRLGRGYNLPATIFVRGAQPIIVGNVFRDNNVLGDAALTAARYQMPVISINANSLGHENLLDYGRSTGPVDLITQYRDNAGPLVRGNQLSNNALNGMVVRGEVLTTQSIWDDTDIVHILTNQFDQQDARNGQRVWAFDEVVIPEHHTFGGLRLQSSPTESLVIKLLGAGQLNNNYNLIDNGTIRNRNAYEGAGFTVSGRPLEMPDRIGGAIHVVGQPGFPVVLTSLHDDTVGAGVQPDGRPQTDTNNNGIGTIPRPNDWRSIRLDQDSNDRNVEVVIEMEPADITAPGINATTNTAQFLGALAPDEKSGDENMRMGFEIHGYLNEPNDVDVYSFTGAAGTEVWLDIDRTTFKLDTIIEILDARGNVLARSDNSLWETEGVDFVSSEVEPGLVGPLFKSAGVYLSRHASGLPKDFYSLNPRDAGMRFALPGNAGTRSAYHIRVRSADGLTSGVYQFQIRTREKDEFPGSTVRFADIRYANSAVEVIGLPKHSPLLGEASEDERTGSSARNDQFQIDPNQPGNRPQYLGNLLASDRAAISVAGNVGFAGDIDFYRFDVRYEAISDPSQAHAATILDVDYADAQIRFNSNLSVFDSAGRLILFAQDSNIADDRSGPLAGIDLADLSRGSVGPKDPYIGPVELPQGTYYATVTSNARIPAELLNNPLVRREPVNSVIRIAEDHIGTYGGSTAADPVIRQLIDPTFVGTGSNLWHRTLDRGNDPGHGLPFVFDLSRPRSTLTSLPEVEPNNTLLTAQNVDAGPWSLNFSPDIGDATVNTSLLIPHLTINGTGDGTFDYYAFTVANAGDRGIFDVDNGFVSAGAPGSFNSQIFLFDRFGNLLASNDDSLISDGAGGSVSTLDSYLEFVFPTPGIHVLAVARSPSTATGGVVSDTPLQIGDVYTLQISLENHPLGGTTGVAGGSSFYFGTGDGTAIPNNVPAGAEGSLRSANFSLKGYSAQDLPVLYFNYFVANNPFADRFQVWVEELNSSGTVVGQTLVASSNASEYVNPSVTQLIQTTFSTWRQARVALDQFAGKENLRLRYHYQAVNAGGEGAYIDDLIIGFAERGEMVTGASINATFAANPAAPAGEIQSGDYQLEIRKGTEFGRSVNNAPIGLLLDRSIDTNDRLAQQATLVAPAGANVQNGQTFTISDGVRSVTFEYEDPEVADGVVGGNVEIPFKTPTGPSSWRLSHDYEIAARIRDAINSNQVQTRLKIRAAKADGEVTGAASTDARVNLFGTAVLDMPADFAITRASNDGNALRDEILGSGVTAVGNATFQGSGTSAGFFVGGARIFGMESGIVLTTGDARYAAGPNADDKSTARASRAGDADFDADLGVTSQDATVLEFDIQLTEPGPTASLYLNFVFASEEYNESVLSGFNDAVAIFIDGENIALVPASTDRVGVDTVYAGHPTNRAYFNANPPGSTDLVGQQFGYDGYTDRFVARKEGLDTTVTHRVKIVIADVGDQTGDSAVFIEANSLADTPFVRPPQGITAILHHGSDDQNLFRDQGQVLIHSNTISHTKTFGIVADAGQRGTDGTQSLSPDARRAVTSAEPLQLAGNYHYSTPVPVRLQSPSPGPVRNLVEPNNTPGAGGFAPGVVIVNNTISWAGVGGIHVSGDSRVFELTTLPGDSVCDAYQFRVTAYGRSVIFEFEDISGSPGPCGSGTLGGNGWTEGTIPIFYRRTHTTPYTAAHPIIPNTARLSGYDEREMAIAIKDAIDASLLVSNDSTLVIHAYTGPSRSAGQFGTGSPAVFLENVSSVTSTGRSTGLASFRVVSHAYGPQPFARVVNNTIFGNDGNYSFFPDAVAEPNDTLGSAVDTRQGRQHNPNVFQASTQIGDGTSFRADASLDVDFYQFELEIGDHVLVDIDAIKINTGLDPVLRLFNSVGEQVQISFGDVVQNRDPAIDFTATAPGTYYVGVSGRGNETYSAVSLAGRSSAATTGDYTIRVNVLAPRSFVITVRNGTSYNDGDTFQIQDVTGAIATFEFDSGGGVTPGNIAIPFNATYRHPEMARVISDSITNSPLNNLQSLPNGRFGVANPLQQVTGEMYGGIAQERFGLEHTDTTPVADPERYVIVRNAARIIDVDSGLLFTPVNNNDEDGLLYETGILVSEQSTPTILNNVLSNLRYGVLQVAFQSGSLGPADVGAAVPGGMVEGGSLYQHTRFNSNTPFAGGDFNIALGNNEPLFVNAPNGNFYPERFARSIDSSIDSLPERTAFESIKRAIGIPLSPILSPDRDVTGQLRVDDPSVDTPGGLGANVFKDRGSLDRADFIGPSAVLVNPQDNDARLLDIDPAVSVVQLLSGILADFTIQIVDGFESADPFPGVGVDDSTLTGRVITIDENGVPLQVKGPAVTLFRDGRFLEEGMDYVYQYDTTGSTIRLTPLSGIWPAGSVYVVKINNRDRFVIDAPRGAAVNDGQVFTITNNVGETATFEFDSGYNVLVVGTTTGPTPGTSTVRDRDLLTISDGARTVVFEFDNDGSFGAQNTVIPLTAGESAAQLADKIVAAVNAANLGLTAYATGNGRINLGGTAAHTVVSSRPASLTVSGRPGVQGGTVLQVPVETAILVPAAGGAGVADGAKFSISDGTTRQVFEFDNNNVFQDDDRNNIPDNLLIQFSGNETQDALAALVVNAIGQARLGLSPRYLGAGVIALGSGPTYTIDLGTSGLQRADRVGRVNDAETFTIDDGTKRVVFEFEDTAVGNGVSAGNVAITFTRGVAVDSVTAAMKAAIDAASLGLQTSVVPGTGQLVLGDDFRHITNVRSSSLTKTGVPRGAIGVPVSGAMDDIQVARLIIDAVNYANTTLGFAGVNAELRGGSTLFVNINDASGQPANFVDGYAAIAGIDAFFLPAVKDLPGNSLKANQATNDTVFTILMPGVELDFGDAPDPFLGEGRYPTYFRNNGARHVVPAVPVLYLGSSVDTEPDGQPTPLADGDDNNGLDDEDGVAFPGLFFPGLSTDIVVTASAPGLLSAWFDWNGDGDWDDPGEQVFANQMLVAGAQTLTVTTPSTAVLGHTFARFRLSSQSNLLPTGLAVDGEVEDYRIRVLSNAPPVVVNSFDDLMVANILPGAILEDSLASPGVDLAIDLENVANSGERVFDDVDITNGNGDFLSYRIVSNDNPVLVTATLNGRMLNLDFGPNQNGIARLVVEATDHAGFSVSDTLTLTVISVNDPPIAVNDVYDVDEGGTLTAASVLGNDSDFHDGAPNENNLPLTAILVGPAPVGLTFEADGTFVYMPPADFGGQVTFTYRAVDSLGAQSELATVTINVNAVNDPPVVTVPGPQTGTEDEDLVITGLDVTDPDAHELRISLRVDHGSLRVTATAGINTLIGNNTGTVTVEGSLDAIRQMLGLGVTYRPNQDYNGADTLVVTANDLGNTGSGGPKTDQKSVLITIAAVNDAPVIVNPIADRTIPEDGPDTVIVLFPGVFMDPDGDPLTFTASSTNTNLVTATVDGFVLTLRLLPDAHGVAVISVTASDGLLTRTTQFTVTVTPVNDPPFARPDSAATSLNTPVLIDVLANDTDVDSAINIASLTIRTAPNNGTAVVQDGKILFTPQQGFTGTSKFTYTVRDVEGAESAPAEVTVAVKAPPIANNDAAQTNQAVAVVIDVLQNDSDPDGTLVPATVVVTVNPARGTATVDPQTGRITYQQTDPLFSGSDTFRYRVRDNDGQLSNEATVAVTITPVRYWQNPSNRFDVNGDGSVSPIDVLQIVNRLNRNQPLPIPPTPTDQPAPYLDVNGSNTIEPNDALQLINVLNAGAGEGEGTSSAGAMTLVAAPAYWEYTGSAQAVPPQFARLAASVAPAASGDRADNLVDEYFAGVADDDARLPQDEVSDQLPNRLLQTLTSSEGDLNSAVDSVLGSLGTDDILFAGIGGSTP